MLERPRLKFYLKSDEANWFKVVNGSAVISNTDKVALTSDPIDWAETDVSYVRHPVYRGVMRSYTAPVTFCEDGAFIIRSVFYTKGYNGRVIFEMEMLDEPNQSQLYKNAYSGEVDFSSVASDNRTSFQTAVLDRGLIAMIKAGQNVPQGIQLLSDDWEVLVMDGLNLRNEVSWLASVIMISGEGARQITPQLDFLSANDDKLLADIKGYRPFMMQEPTSYMCDTNYFYRASGSGVAHVQFKGSIFVEEYSTYFAANSGFIIQVHLKRGSSTFITTLFQSQPLTQAQEPTFTVDVGADFNVLPGDTLTLIMGVGPYHSTTNPDISIGFYYYVCTNGNLSLNFPLSNPVSYVPCYRQIDVWRKCVQKITGSAQYGVVSNYLTDPAIEDWGNVPYNTVITSGDGARGLGTGDEFGAAEIKVKMSELFDDLNSRCLVGLGIDGDNVRIEPLSYFFDKGLVALKLGVVKDFEVTVDKGMLYNVLNVGYVYDSDQTLNGKQDPFTTFVYNVPVRYVDKSEEWVSPFIASIYRWEQLRLNLSGTGENTLADNKILLCEVKALPDANGRLLPRRHQLEPGGYLQNLEAGDTAYNLALLPEYNLRRKSALLHGTMHLLTEPLKFQRADQNKAVISTLGTAYPEVKASADYKPVDMDTMLYPPHFFKFNYPAPPEFDALLMGGRNALIEFDTLIPKTNTIVTLRGFLEKASVIQGRNEPSEWLLRPAPDTDFSKLIY